MTRWRSVQPVNNFVKENLPYLSIQIESIYWKFNSLNPTHIDWLHYDTSVIYKSMQLKQLQQWINHRLHYVELNPAVQISTHKQFSLFIYAFVNRSRNSFRIPNRPILFLFNLTNIGLRLHLNSLSRRKPISILAGALVHMYYHISTM